MKGMDLDLPPIPDAERTPLVETLLGIIDLLRNLSEDEQDDLVHLLDKLHAALERGS